MSLSQRSAAGALRVTSGRTVSKAAPARRACIDKADHTRRRTKEIVVDAVLGIDIAKAKFDVALRRVDGTVRRKSCPNTPAGFVAPLAGPTAGHAGARDARSHGDLRRRACPRPV